MFCSPLNMVAAIPASLSVNTLTAPAAMAMMQQVKGIKPLRSSVKASAAKPVAAVERAGRAALVAAPLLAAAPAVRAAEAPVDDAVDTVIGAVKATGEVLKNTLTAVDSGVKVLKEGYDIAAPVVGQAVKAATPVVEQALKTTVDVASPAIKAVVPTLQEAGKALSSSGINSQTVNDATSVISKTTTTAVSTATPFITKFFQFLASADPVTLGEYALGAIVLFYATPAVLGTLGGSFRGYAGDLAAAAALNSLVNDSNVLLVDIRTAKEKETSGIPDLPSGASSKVVEVEYALTEDKRLRGNLRDPSAIEAQITALQIAALKKISKGTKLVLLDRYGPAARTVAKELNRKGYNKVFVIQGGFDGRSGWVQSKLQIKPAANLSTAIAPPQKTTFTRGSRALPAPK